jgi:PilZ domain
MGETTINRRRDRRSRAIPLELALDLRPAQWWNTLAGNLCVQWLDVSEGGLGVLSARPLAEGRRFHARFASRIAPVSFKTLVEVRHSRLAHSRPGSYVVGLQFVGASALVRACTRSLVDNGSLPARGLVVALRRMCS